MPGSHARRDSAQPTGPSELPVGHGHGHGPAPDVAITPRARRLLLGFLVTCLLATLAGVVLLWPDGEKVDAISDEVRFAAPGVTFPRAEVLDVESACAAGTVGDDCGKVRVRVLEGEGRGAQVSVPVPPDVTESGLREGDQIKLLRTPSAEQAPETYNYFGTVRTTPVLILLVLFVVVVLAVARWRGLMALIGLLFAAAVLWRFLLPALLSGQPPVLVAAVAASLIMFVVLYTTHGWSLRTSAALAGTLGGIALTATLGHLAVRGSRVTGVVDEGSRILSTVADDLSFQGLFACAVVVAGLGVLNDVTITQASSVWEIRAAAPSMSRRAVFASGMRIGRDHIASTIYTIVFAYAGTALVILMVLSLYDRPLLDLLATEEIGQEVVRTLATSIGLVLAVPLTTAIAAATLPRAQQASNAVG
ncbi:YibE/F family protein [Nocardioides sp. R-C-SC26]|uniref:YibE/F family protein n=1 Tax=Nocardioides sp. R-C-SC26 TaxID=2870414 RepID=UPI001E44F1C9|nr:YibE/F family protein [Nocardioides sp. R-C-SC26]